jgi:hypothetical protein
MITNSVILALSVLTSGALWLIVSHSAPKGTEFIGATISTLVTFLTIFLYASGLEAKRRGCLQLYKDIGEFIAQLRVDPNFVDEQQRVDKFKKFEFELRKIRFGPTS